MKARTFDGALFRQLTRPEAQTRLGYDMGCCRFGAASETRASVLLTFAAEVNCSRLKYPSLV
jgi:hypothetical protein